MRFFFFILLIPFLIFGISANTAAQSMNINGKLINVSNVALYSSVFETLSPVIKSTSIWDSIRALSEINTIDADAYPYISPDGLSLYYTKQEAGIKKLVVATRGVNDYATPFTNVQVVGNGFSGLISSWFTNDQLELYYSDGSSIYMSSRSSVGDVFSAPQPLTINGYSGFISAHSLTPNKQEMFVYNVDVLKSVLHCTNTGGLNYVVDDTLEIPDGYFATTGQLSKDGLSYYVSIDSIGSFSLYKMTRAAMMDTFSNLTKLSGSINDNALINNQPTITTDESIIVFVKNDLNSWEDNDLYISSATGTVGMSEAVRPIDVKVFPNPANQFAVFEFNEIPDLIRIYDMQGRIIINNRLISDTYRLDLSRFNKGIYHYSILSDKTVATGKLIIE